MTAVLERPRPVPEALIEEARGRQRQRRALIGFLVLLVGAVLALPVIASDGSGSSAERFGDRFGPLHQRLTSPPGPPLHTATTVLYSGLRFIDPDPRAGQINDAYREGLDSLNETFRRMIESRGVVRTALDRSGARRSVDAVVDELVVTQQSRNLIEVSVTDRHAETARILADAIADVFLEQVNAGFQFDPRDEPIVSIYERARETS